MRLVTTVEVGKNTWKIKSFVTSLTNLPQHHHYAIILELQTTILHSWNAVLASRKKCKTRFAKPTRETKNCLQALSQALCDAFHYSNPNKIPRIKKQNTFVVNVTTCCVDWNLTGISPATIRDSILVCQNKWFWRCRRKKGHF